MLNNYLTLGQKNVKILVNLLNAQQTKTPSQYLECKPKECGLVRAWIWHLNEGFNLLDDR